MLECILKIEFFLNLSKQMQEKSSKKVQHLVEEGEGKGVTSTLTTAKFLWNLFIHMMPRLVATLCGICLRE